MPKAKLNKSSTSFMTYGHPLSEVAQKTLIEILGFGTVDLQAESINHQFPRMKILRNEPGEPILLVADNNSKADPPKSDLGMIILNIESALGLFVDGSQHIDNIPRSSDYVNTFEIIRKRATLDVRTPICRWGLDCASTNLR